MKAIIEALLQGLVPLAVTAVSAGTAWAAAHLAALLKSKAQSSRLAAAASVLDDYAFNIVTDIENTEKAALAANGGKFDGAQLKALAVSRLKLAIGPEGVAELEKALGALFGGSVDAVLQAKVEQAVAKVGA